MLGNLLHMLQDDLCTTKLQVRIHSSYWRVGNIQSSICAGRESSWHKTVQMSPACLSVYRIQKRIIQFLEIHSKRVLWKYYIILKECRVYKVEICRWDCNFLSKGMLFNGPLWIFTFNPSLSASLIEKITF